MVWFSRFSRLLSAATGKASTFSIAILMIVVWGATGPYFDFSDTWQLIINTTTTIITFLMVFLIQNTQNRDTTAIQLKLDELLRATESARNNFLNLESLDDETLEKVRERYEKLARAARGRGHVSEADALEDVAEELEDVEKILASKEKKEAGAGSV